MKVLIAEDEMLAAERLQNMLQSIDPAIEVVAIVESLTDLKKELIENKEIELLFLDIELSDGKSLKLFEELEIKQPVVFTTAYDAFALDAFKYLSLGYLLKPINLNELKAVLDKVKLFTTHESVSDFVSTTFEEKPRFKSKFLIKNGNRLLYKSVEDALYFFADGKEVYFLNAQDNRKYLIDYTLEQLENSLDPNQFFRISRKIILNVDAVEELKGFSNLRFEVRTNKPVEHALHVSRNRIKDFKSWLNR